MDQRAIQDQREALHHRIDNDFAAHPPEHPRTKLLLDEVADDCARLAHQLIELCPPGRELSLALTDLESAKHNAIASIACHQDQLPWSSEPS